MNPCTSNVGEKFLEIRELMGLSRKKMELILKLPERSLERIEKQKGKVSFEYVQLLLQEFPEFTYWIIHGQVNIDAGQIDPKLYQAFLINSEHKVLFNWKDEVHISIMKEGISKGLDKLLAYSSLQMRNVSEVNNEAFMSIWRKMKPDFPTKNETDEKYTFTNIKKWNALLENGEISNEEYMKYMDTDPNDHP